MKIEFFNPKKTKTDFFGCAINVETKKLLRAKKMECLLRYGFYSYLRGLKFFASGFYRARALYSTHLKTK